MRFCSHTLENGLEIVAEVNPDAYSASLGFFVRAGSRDETDALAGASHFLEHMAFKGTAVRSADDVNREFDELGAHYNACTSEENTIFHATVLPEYQDSVVALLADILRPALRADDFETEKQVILEEISMYEDMPPFGADDKCRAAFFGDHPLARGVLGTVESIGRLTVEEMRDYFALRYGPSNVVLVAAGRVDFDELVKTADRTCGFWTPSAARRESPPVAPNERFLVVEKPAATQEYAVSFSAGPSAQSPLRHAARLLAAVLGDEPGGRLYWELVDPGLAEQAGLIHCDFLDAGAMMTFMSCSPELFGDNLRLIREIYQQTEARGIEVDELRQAKNKTRARLVISSERSQGRLFMVGGDWIARRECLSVDDELAAIDAVTLDEVHSLLATDPLTKNTTIAIGPLANVRKPK